MPCSAPHYPALAFAKTWVQNNPTLFGCTEQITHFVKCLAQQIISPICVIYRKEQLALSRNVRKELWQAAKSVQSFSAQQYNRLWYVITQRSTLELEPSSMTGTTQEKFCGKKRRVVRAVKQQGTVCAKKVIAAMNCAQQNNKW